MQPTEYAARLEHLSQLLNLNALVQLLEYVVEDVEFNHLSQSIRSKGAIETVLEAHAAYTNIESRDLKSLAHALNLDLVFAPKAIAALISSIHDSARGKKTVSIDASSLETALAHLRAAITARELFKVTILENREPSITDAEGTLDLEIVDFDGHGIELRRLERVIGSLDRVYGEVARFEEEEKTSLRISLIESGSGILLIVAGAKKAVSAVAEALHYYWSKLVLLKYDRFDRIVGSVDKTLALFERIQKAEKKGAVSSEEAQRLKYFVEREMQTLLHNGVIRKDDFADERVDGRKLLGEAPSYKLLGPGTPTE